MINLHTRKSIGDKAGERSIYVVEYRSAGKWCHANWANDIYSSTHKGAVILKNKVYKEFKKANRIWTRKDFRVALYVRAERE